MTKKPETKGENQETTNIYQKLQLIQEKVKELVRSEENKFQKYKYFDELQVLHSLKPLLAQHQLTVLISDDETKDFYCEPAGNMWLVKYGKKCEIFNSVNPAEKLTYFFWASALNQDPAKAKGSAETYAIKYFLSKFFLIPVKDEGDPDALEKPTKEEKVEEKITAKPQTKETITIQQSQELHDLFIKKRGKDQQIHADFLTEVNKIMTTYGITGTTNSNNLKGRLASLSEFDYQSLWNYLQKLPDKE